MQRSVFLGLLILITGVGLLFRLPGLGNRPMHGDEAVHAFKFEDLWKHGTYRYDPNEYHGPTIYYAALPVVIARGRHNLTEVREADLRFPIALFGAGLVLLLGLLGDALGCRSVLYAAVLIAISPAFVFYSRYYIQEMLLVFFTLSTIGFSWRWERDRRPVRSVGWSVGWSVLAGTSAGLMVASKETAVLTFGAALGALALCIVWSRSFDRTLPSAAHGGSRACAGEQPGGPGRETDSSPRGPSKPEQPQTEPPERHARSRSLAVALIAALAAASLLLSGFLSHPAAPLLYLKAFTPWLHRAQGLGLHRHPWFYYLRLLLWTHEPGGPVWSEGLILALAVVGVIAVLAPRRAVDQEETFYRGRRGECAPEAARGEVSGVVRRDGQQLAFQRFIVFFTILLTLGYSLIPYKTPWCLLSFLLGMILVAGLGVEALLIWLHPHGAKIAIAVALAVAAIQLGAQSYRTSFVAFADERNPYVYAQPGPDVEKLARRVEVLTNASPDRDRTVIQVFSVDNYYWPLPWYLRRFRNVGYWTAVPADASAPVILSSPEFDEELTRRLNDTDLMTGYFRLRRGTFFEVWVRMDLWSSYLQQKKEKTSDLSGLPKGESQR